MIGTFVLQREQVIVQQGISNVAAFVLAVCRVRQNEKLSDGCRLPWSIKGQKVLNDINLWISRHNVTLSDTPTRISDIPGILGVSRVRSNAQGNRRHTRDIWHGEKLDAKRRNVWRCAKRCVEGMNVLRQELRAPHKSAPEGCDGEQAQSWQT